jgi:hypothetical protein
MIKWHRLSNDEANNIIKIIKSSAIPSLFSSKSSEVKCMKLPFYKEFMLYRITNYSSLPAFSLDYLGDEKKFYYLDGSARAIVDINLSGKLSLGVDNILDYVQFFFAHISGVDGDIEVIIDLDEHNPLSSLPEDKLKDIRDMYKEPVISFDDKTQQYNIKATIDNEGTLVYGNINVTKNGNVSINEQNMLFTQHEEEHQNRVEA